MGLADLFTWRNQSAAIADEDDVPAEVDEPPEKHIHFKQPPANFHKSSVIPQSFRKQSLLTQAIQNGNEPENCKSNIVTTDLTRRRSMISNASLASTAELTSDGGLTSPARTNTPSPPLPRSTYTGFAPASAKAYHATTIPKLEANGHLEPDVISVSPKNQPAVPAVEAPRKRCITFVCDGKREAATKPAAMTTKEVVSAPAIVAPQPQQPRKCTIKFACPGPKASEIPVRPQAVTPPLSKSPEIQKRALRSPSIPRKSPRPASLARAHRDSSGTVRRVSQSPTAVRAKPKFIIADEKTLRSSEATRFHEFASEELQEDDWIREDTEVPKTKLTINDTLKLENQIRRLGSEAEEEALEEDDDDEEGNDSDDENDDDDDDEDNEDDENDSDEDASDGNESDNEAGFAESDDSDGEGEFAFWTPGRILRGNLTGSTFRPSAHRAPSASSIDSLNHTQLSNDEGMGKRLRRRPIKIRPGTPDLPDSTDFVCGTLDEDRPLEEAYVSCMEARKNARHKLCPQDIDPSFPTSDPEDEEDEHDDVKASHDSDEHLWLHGKFEESDDERKGRRRSNVGLHRRKSPAPRIHPPPPPKRMHSPPPKTRLRSPPPRKLFGNSPKRMRSPPPARTIRSPPASPTTTSQSVRFAPLGSRPGLTHTKSLPRTPNAFCRAYQISRLEAANGNDGTDNTDGYSRGAIDIVKGLEQKRQRRKEKFLQKNIKKAKGHTERRPQPGKGAERMRELGLLMAGKTGQQDPYILSA